MKDECAGAVSLSVAAGLSLQAAHACLPAAFVFPSYICLLVDLSLPSSLLCRLSSPASTSTLPPPQSCGVRLSALTVSRGKPQPVVKTKPLMQESSDLVKNREAQEIPPLGRDLLYHHVLPCLAHQYCGAGPVSYPVLKV
ncbi:unnamed protein product [Pleuronectes platessa]|uniref:Uncharacterized protein n=1 Tax=Pleuronectes platessa TaxID=8262 RepID=A0A9N7Y4S5_PLEPL|nr:unnamed protein product [Pleuronectes platessa]